MSNFRQFDRATGFLLPPSLDEWLPERHLARFVVEVIDGLNLSAMVKSYRGSGSASYHPALLLDLLVYGYTTGVFSSRKLERATYDSVAFRFIAANDHPNHDTIATFRRRFLKVSGTCLYFSFNINGLLIFVGMFFTFVAPQERAAMVNGGHPVLLQVEKRTPGA
jgi:transposase